MVCNEYEYMLDRCMYKIAKFIVTFGDVTIYLYRTQHNLHYKISLTTTFLPATGKYKRWNV